MPRIVTGERLRDPGAAVKILFAGDWHSTIHERACSQALTAEGHEVVEFRWCDYFGGYAYAQMPVMPALSARLQHRFVAGPRVRRMNADLLQLATRERPDLVFVYRPTHVLASTVKALKTAGTGAVVVGYTNDDPFSDRAPRTLWRHLRAAIPFYDIHFVYRQHNVDEFIRHGATRARVLRSFFVPEVHRPIALTPDERSRFASEVVFAGHFENDRRVEFLRYALAQGSPIRLFGPDWGDAPADLGRQDGHPVEPVWGDDYARALCGSKIALCFLSTLNRDTYTRRCFEIPATGTFMLSQYSDDLASLFKEGEEADFFRSPEELVSKIDFYLTHEAARVAIAEKGRAAVWRDGHDVRSRMREMITYVRGAHDTQDSDAAVSLHSRV